jgi:hypothetical protein
VQASASVDCPALQDLDGLAHIIRVSHFDLQPLPYGTCWAHHSYALLLLLLPPLLCTAGISIVANDCPALQDLDGFARITRVPGDLQLYLLGSLPDLRGLAALQEVGLNLVVGANGLLTSMTGLSECIASAALRSILSCGF